METSTSHVFQTQVKEILGLDLSPLETLLTNLDSSQPLALQSHAQTLLTFCKTHNPNSLSLKLAFLLCSSHRIDTRLASATLLCRLLTPAGSHLWPRLPKITQNEIKSILLASLPKEFSRKVAKILCNLISDIGLEIFPRNEWPELLDFLFRSLGHDSFGSQLHILQESALVLFSNLSPKLGDIDIVFHRVDLLHLAFLKSMDSSCASHVRVAAFKASVNLVVFLITPSSYDRFQDLLFEMVKTTFELINMEQHEYAQSVLEDLIVLAATKPGFLRVHVATVVDSMLKVAEKVSLEEKTRQLGIEFVITLAEEREQGCGMVRKLPHLIIRLLSLLMKMLAVIEDDSSWHIAESDEDNCRGNKCFLLWDGELESNCNCFA
ncbi:hypothetical protein L1049_002381 [Liquidambar formosana]|uniref:IPO4/5-like TPR repeats domain-containing protein n=1 Tax=Liquidambar formosana TaxID=63359 RepID=A0AAP0NET7_LIQFO